jgi:hypothetical protein
MSVYDRNTPPALIPVDYDPFSSDWRPAPGGPSYDPRQTFQTLQAGADAAASAPWHDATLSATTPTWRNSLAQWMMGDTRTSAERANLVQGLTGTTGAGDPGMSVVGLTPPGAVFDAQEALNHGDYKGATLSALLGAAPIVGALGRESNAFGGGLRDLLKGSAPPEAPAPSLPLSPAVPPRPVLPPFDVRPTRGIFYPNEGGEIPLESGAPDPRYSNYPIAKHVEGKAAIIIRDRGLSGV